MFFFRRLREVHQEKILPTVSANIGTSVVKVKNEK